MRDVEVDVITPKDIDAFLRSVDWLALNEAQVHLVERIGDGSFTGRDVLALMSIAICTMRRDGQSDRDISLACAGLISAMNLNDRANAMAGCSR